MPIRTTPFPKRPARFGQEELSAVKAAMDRNELWYWHDNSIVETTAKAAAAIAT